MVNPTDVKEVKVKIENGEVKVKGKKGKKKEAVATKTKAERRTGTVDEAKVLAWMKEQGEKEITSTTVRDAFGLSKRANARNLMKSLAKAGKVQKIEAGEGKKRKHYTYKLVEVQK